MPSSIADWDRSLSSKCICCANNSSSKLATSAAKSLEGRGDAEKDEQFVRTDETESPGEGGGGGGTLVCDSVRLPLLLYANSGVVGGGGGGEETSSSDSDRSSLLLHLGDCRAPSRIRSRCSGESPNSAKSESSKSQRSSPVTPASSKRDAHCISHMPSRY